MKPTVSSPLISFTFLLLLSKTLTALPVKDTDGHELEAGKLYFIVPAAKSGDNIEGGVFPIPRNFSASLDSCLVLAFELGNYVEGQAATFVQADQHGSGSIPLSKDLNIRFEPDIYSIPCYGNGIWRADHHSREFGTSGTLTLTSDGDFNTEESLFRIEESDGGDRSYKLRHCHDSVCKCGEIGTLVNNEFMGAERLVLSDGQSNGNVKPFLVKFKKANSESHL